MGISVVLIKPPGGGQKWVASHLHFAILRVRLGPCAADITAYTVTALGCPNTLLSNGTINTFIPSAVLQQEQREKNRTRSHDCLPFRACLFLNGFYVTPEFRCVKRRDLETASYPKPEAGGKHHPLPPTCSGSVKSARGLVVWGNLLWWITLQPSHGATLGWNHCFWGDRGGVFD